MSDNIQAESISLSQYIYRDIYCNYKDIITIMPTKPARKILSAILPLHHTLLVDALTDRVINCYTDYCVTMRADKKSDSIIPQFSWCMEYYNNQRTDLVAESIFILLGGDIF